MADPSEGYQLSGVEETRGGKKQRLFSNSFAQLMVFFNGLILTLTAYFTLSIFVTDIVNESLSKLPTEAQSYVADRFSDLQQSLYSVSVLVSVMKDEGRQDLIAVLKDSPVKVDGFSHILWVSRSEDDWSVKELYRGAEDVSEWYSDDFADFIVSRGPANTGITQLVVGFKSEKSFESRQGNMQRPVGLVRLVNDESGERQGYLVGIAELESVLLEWLGRQVPLASMTVLYRDNFQSFPLYEYLSAGHRHKAQKVHDSKQFQALLGNLPVFVSVGVAITEREAFIQNIPFLLLIFGISLTLIGTLYVRNNYKQSLRLSDMNRTLAQKNYDLSVEVRERERLNKAIKKAERENRAIIDSVSDIIFETDTKGNILFLNEAWHTVTGIEVGDIVGESLFGFIYPQDREEQKNNFELLVKGKRNAYRSFTRIRTSENEYRAVELGVSMLRHDANKNMHVVGTIVDVEERRRTEQALSEAERKYRTIVENAAGGIYQMSSDGQYLSANPAMAKILGYDAPQDLLSSVTDVNHKVYKDSRRRMRFLRELEDFGDPQLIEAEVYRSDGNVIWVSESARAVFDENGRLMFYEGSMNDVTERKQAEIKLKDAKIQSDLASRAKSEFLTNMSHELRTPLNAIIGFSEIIKNQAFGPVGGQEYLDYAQDIHDGGKRLLNVINEILDVSRIEAGDRVLNEGVVDLKPLVQSCIDLMGPKIEANDMIVSNTIPEDFPNLIGEELAVKQMIMNLLSNAVKYTASGGRVTISAEMNDSGGIRLSITDTGVGLDDEEIEKAMSPFGQVENKHNKSSSGTGLGLTLVDALIKLHQGRLELFSQKGIGTTATLVFPARRVTRRGSSTPSDVHFPQPFTKSEN